MFMKATFKETLNKKHPIVYQPNKKNWGETLLP